MKVIGVNHINHMWGCIDILMHTSVLTFVFISGYFGINFKFSRLLNIVGIVIFYSLILSCVSVFVFNEGDALFIIKSFLPFTNGYYWFIAVYLELYLLSPILNYIRDNISDKMYLYVIIILSFIIYYLGWIRHDLICIDGKNILNFCQIYLVAGAFKRFGQYNWVKHACSLRFNMAVLLVAAIMLLAMYFLKHESFIVFVLFINKYNSPILLCISIAIFNLFNKTYFNSKYVNYLASSSLAIYLMHEHPLIQKYIYISFFQGIKDDYSSLILLVIVIIYALVLAISCIFIDKIRVLFFSPIENRIIKLFEHKMQ